MSTLELKELSHPAGEVIKIASGKTLDLKTQGSVTMPTGSVLQVVSATYSAAVTMGVTANSWYDVTGMTKAITPSSTSNKVLININLGALDNSSGAIGFRIMRGNTAIALGDVNSSRQRMSFRFSGNADDGNHNQSLVFSFLDSPSTTGAVTYKIMFAAEGTTAVFNRTLSYGDDATIYNGVCASNLTLMEIQG
jgi:hypothetical protein